MPEEKTVEEVAQRRRENQELKAEIEGLRRLREGPVPKQADEVLEVPLPSRGPNVEVI